MRSSPLFERPRCGDVGKRTKSGCDGHGPKARTLGRPALALGLLALGACTGGIDHTPAGPAEGPYGVTPGDGDSGGGGGSGGGGRPRCDPAILASGEPTPGPSTIRRMTRQEYNHTVLDLLGDTTRPADQFAQEEKSAGFNNNADALTVSPLLAEQYLTAAEEIAARATEDIEKLLGCQAADACVRAFLTQFGERAYRRPLSDDERTQLFAVFDDGGARYDARTGVQWMLQAMLQSPHFLYRVEHGVPAKEGAEALALTSWEVASRLSYFLAGTMPDKELREAARNDALQTKAQVEAQARRLLADARAREVVDNFHEQWLSLDLVTRMDKDPTLYPTFDAGLRDSMRGEIDAFIRHVVWEGSGGVELLFTAPYSFIDKNLSAHYGVTFPGGEGFQRVELDPAQRAGLLTQAGILALGAKSDQTSPIHRGQFVREKLLCTPLPPPPPGIVVEAPDPDPTLTTRERFAQHASDPACSGCHQLMDPIGVGFENYDAIGRFRSEENGLPVDSTGEVVSSDLPGSFEGAVELANQLAESEEVKRCMVRQWFRFSYGRLETQADACTLDGLMTRFDESGNDVVDLLVALTLTDAFRYRLTGANQ